ncbi:MAG: hypothetical protein A2314_07950 [Elusimicrobia bacterium RIFOXYB2_FULL_50_12]|nr:MAG: hypothetical protein A2314_07950 [Elusimicrobia bacterium RIFOXYB2_FULL_50_12]
MKLKFKIIVAVVLLAVPLAIFVTRHRDNAGGNGAQSVRNTPKKYTCPMHPHYVAEKPGDCPICGMSLVTVEEDIQVPASTQTNSRPAKKKNVMYRSTMNPNEVSDKPGKDSMGMEMEPFEVEEEPAGPQVEGFTTIKVPLEKQRMMGVKTGVVEIKDVVKIIRTTGRVAYDPDLYYAEQEYLSSLKTYERSKGASREMVSSNAKSLVDASRMRLKLLGLGDDQIESLAERNSPDSSLLLPRGDKVWVYASIYEEDMKFVKAGQSVVMTAPAITPDKFDGEVVAVDPVLDPATRSAKARIMAANPLGALRPESYLNVEINIPLGNRLVVPADAVMDTGTRHIVFVDKGDGGLEPREVSVGYMADDVYVIKSGVSEGESVVTNANFLIDSESRLKSSMQKAAGAAGEHKH